MIPSHEGFEWRQPKSPILNHRDHLDHSSFFSNVLFILFCRWLSFFFFFYLLLSRETIRDLILPLVLEYLSSSCNIRWALSSSFTDVISTFFTSFSLLLDTMIPSLKQQWKARWCVLTKLSPVAGEFHVLLFPDIFLPFSLMSRGCDRRTRFPSLVLWWSSKNMSSFLPSTHVLLPFFSKICWKYFLQWTRSSCSFDDDLNLQGYSSVIGDIRCSLSLATL